MKTHDAVVIGSGIGGLACGALLARKGMKVAVLEKHSLIGGYAHSFQRGAFRFESSIHSVPMSSSGFIFHLLKLLNIADKVQTIAHPSMYRVMSAEIDFTIPAKKEDVLSALFQAFPHEKKALKEMFGEMRKFYDIFLKPLFSLEETFYEKDRKYLAKYANCSYKSFIDSFIHDEKLRYILYSQWPYFGASAGVTAAPFAFLAFYVHVLEGSHYLQGGFSTLARALASVIVEKGGQVRTNACVSRLRIEGDMAHSAVLDTGEEIEADVYISNISPYALHKRIIDEPARNKIWLRRLETLRPSVSAIAVYVGLDNGFAPLPDSNVVLWYGNGNHEAIYAQMQNNIRRPIDHLFMLKTPHASEKTTLLLLHYIHQSYSSNWRKEKLAFAEKMLDRAEALAPGLRKHTACLEIGTPDTFERYTANTSGAILGFENSKDVYREAKLPIRTYIKNLFQTGHWCPPGGGVWNVMECAYVASKIIAKATGAGKD